jgi:hypothetical protein
MKYGRHVSIRVGPAGATGVEVKGLTIAFDVFKSIEVKNNKATVTVYNLSNPTIDSFFQKDHLLYLYAGYEDPAPLVFSGEITDVETAREEADKVTKIECFNGQSVLKKEKPEISMAPNTSNTDIVQTLVDGMGIQYDVSSLGIEGKAKQGYSSNGNYEEELRQILSPLGFEFNLDDAGIQIFKKNQINLSVEAVVVSNETGLISGPHAKKKDDKNKVWSFKSLLEPKIFSGGYVVLPNQTGKARVLSVKHVGDNRDGEAYSEVEVEYV